MSIPPISARQYSHIRQLLASKSEREKSGLFVVEGLKGVMEAVRSNLSCKVVLASQKGLLQLEQEGIKPLKQLVTCDDASYAKLSLLQTPPGILAVVAIPSWNLEKILEGASILALDAVADPGNVGTLLRAADWFGFDGVLIGKGSVDPTNPKVVQASMGSLTRLPWWQGELRELLPQMQQQGWSTVALTLQGDSLDASAEKLCYIVGSESHGVKPDLIRMAKQEQRIEGGENGAESLNAAIAGSLVLHQRYAHLARAASS